MNRTHTYEVRIEGHLSDQWLDWFDGLAIHHEADGVTVLRGPLPDQSALLGMLNKLHSLNLTVISVERSSPGRPCRCTS